MASNWRLLITPAANGAWNMAVDEAILKHAGRGESGPTLRLFAWDPACLSLGYAQPFSDVDEGRLRERGWDVVRRPTGGRAILHTDELTYSITARGDEPLVAGTLLESYNRIAAGLLQAIQALGIEADIRPGEEVRHNSVNPVCFEVPSAYEITVNGRKLIGSAQARRKEGVLQHGSLPLVGDLGRITDGLRFEDEAERSEARQRLLERATTVESALGRRVSWEDAVKAFASGFETALGLKLEEQPLARIEAQRAEVLVAAKYGHDTWTKRV
jgi:lipoate-protein ligase A